MSDETAAEWDVAVIGAGAAGLMAAIRAAEKGRRVIILEKNRKPGVKILMSGGTRCNITNARGLHRPDAVSGGIDPAFDRREAKGTRSIQEAFAPHGAFLGPALRAFGADAAVAFFESHGVATKIEGNGKVFPVSDRAVDVLRALLDAQERSGAALRLASPCLEIDVEADGTFRVGLPDGPIRAKKLIIASGGQSFPGCGTTGDGYGWARRFGHTVTATKPALVPICVQPAWVPELKGITLPDVLARIVRKDGKILDSRREAVLFAHFGLTGPAILDVSRTVAHAGIGDGLSLSLDLIPDQRPEAVDQHLQATSRVGRRPVAALLPEALPRRFAESLLIAAEIPPGRMGPELSRDERRRLTTALKALALPITGTLGYAKAEVTSGGVCLDEVDSKSLESKIQPGLHWIGEVLDLDGRIGGYNFQAAWSTGWLAGDSA